MAAFKVQLDQVSGVVSVYGGDRFSLYTEGLASLPIHRGLLPFCIHQGAVSSGIHNGSLLPVEGRGQTSLGIREGLLLPLYMSY